MKTGKRLFIISLMSILTFSLISVFAENENYVRSEDTYKGICQKISVLGFDDDVIYGYRAEIYQSHSNFTTAIPNYEVVRSGRRFVGTLYLNKVVEMRENWFKGVYIGDLYDRGWAR